MHEFVNHFQELHEISYLKEDSDVRVADGYVAGTLDKRYSHVEGIDVPAKDARFQVARIVLNGVAAALDAVYWVDVHSAVPITAGDARSSSHPPHHFRWNLITAYVKGIAQLEDDTVLSNCEVIAASQDLSVAYKEAIESCS
jgi:hypothetical protein